MRKMESIETLDELEVEFNRALRAYRTSEQRFDQSTFSGNPKLAGELYKELNHRAAVVMRLHRAKNRCETVVRQNPFLRLVLALREMNEPELGKKLSKWAEMYDEVI